METVKKNNKTFIQIDEDSSVIVDNELVTIKQKLYDKENIIHLAKSEIIELAEMLKSS